MGEGKNTLQEGYKKKKPETGLKLGRSSRLVANSFRKNTRGSFRVKEKKDFARNGKRGGKNSEKRRLTRRKKKHRGKFGVCRKKWVETLRNAQKRGKRGNGEPKKTESQKKSSG